MASIREYLMQVTAAALICGIITAVTGKKGSIAATVRLMTVLFMALTVLGPVAGFRLSDAVDYFDSIRWDGTDYADQGVAASKEAMATIIKEKTEAYILDKAEAMGAKITVEVVLTDEQIPVPKGVRIRGTVSPYGKSRLQTLIKEELGIPLEEQKWN